MTVVEVRTRSRAHAILCLSLSLLAVFTLVIQVYAVPSVSYRLWRRGGYTDIWLNELLGVFQLDAVCSPDVVRVEFYLDDQLVLNATVPPFIWVFNTADFYTGQHTFNITVYDGVGESASITFEKTFIAQIPLSFFIVMGMLFSIPVMALVGKYFHSKRNKQTLKNGLSCIIFFEIVILIAFLLFFPEFILGGLIIFIIIDVLWILYNIREIKKAKKAPVVEKKSTSLAF